MIMWQYGNVGADGSEFDLDTGLLIKGKLTGSVWIDFTYLDSYDPKTRTLKVHPCRPSCFYFHWLMRCAQGSPLSPYVALFNAEPLAGYVWNHSKACKPTPSSDDWKTNIFPILRLRLAIVFTEDFREFDLQYYFGDQPLFKAPGPPVAPGMQLASDPDGTGRVWHRETFENLQVRGNPEKVARYELRRVIDANGKIDQENWDLMEKMWGTRGILPRPLP